MRLGKRIAIGLLLVPVAEVITFLLVAWAIGFLPALALTVLTSLAGCLVLRHAGRGQLSRLRGTVDRAGTASFAASGAGLMVALSGILLLLPGFITDLAGALLLVPQVRRRLGATIGRAIDATIGGAGPGAPAGSVVDLDRREWREVPDRELPKPHRG